MYTCGIRINAKLLKEELNDIRAGGIRSRLYYVDSLSQQKALPSVVWMLASNGGPALNGIGLVPRRLAMVTNIS